MPVYECDVDDARGRLLDGGIEVVDGNTDHEQWRASTDGATAIAYDGKVVVQGARPREIESHLREEGGRTHVYFDGACHGNPGPGAVGWVLVNGDGIVADGGERIGETTNNRAEYEALIRALTAAYEFGFDRVDVRGDSELIVRQVRGEWNTNDPELRELRVTARELLDRFDAWTLEHVPREVNERADELATEALDHD